MIRLYCPFLPALMLLSVPASTPLLASVLHRKQLRPKRTLNRLIWSCTALNRTTLNRTASRTAISRAGRITAFSVVIRLQIWIMEAALRLMLRMSLIEIVIYVLRIGIPDHPSAARTVIPRIYRKVTDRAHLLYHRTFPLFLRRIIKLTAPYPSTR